MDKVDKASDFEGRPMEKGDTVAVLSDNTSAKIAELARDGEEEFVRLRPLHQPYGKGVWHAADRVVWLASTRKPKPKTESNAKANPTAKTSVKSPARHM